LDFNKGILIKYLFGVMDHYDTQQMKLYSDIMKSITTVYLHWQEQQVYYSKLDKQAVENL
jgi:hypothetical protein